MIKINILSIILPEWMFNLKCNDKCNVETDANCSIWNNDKK